MNYSIKKKSIVIFLTIITLVCSLSHTVNASNEEQADWKEVYYNFMTDYTRLYPDMNSEIIQSGNYGNPDFINGVTSDFQDFREGYRPLYHKTENMKLLNLTDSSIPEIVVFHYGNFTGDWIGSSNLDSDVKIYKYENGKVEEIFKTNNKFLKLYYKETDGTADVIVQPRYTQYDDGTDYGPQVSNLIWSSQKQKMEKIVDEELTHLFYNNIEETGSTDHLSDYFEDKGYNLLYQVDKETNTIVVEDDGMDYSMFQGHYIEYISESQIKSMLAEYPDAVEKNVSEETVDESISNEKTSEKENSKENVAEEVVPSSAWDRFMLFIRNYILDPLISIFNGSSDNIVDEDTNNIESEELESKEDKEIVEDLDSDHESSKDGFRTYVNHKFGFSVDYPASFNKDASSNEDFVKFNSEDKKASLTATGEENISGESLSSLYQKDIDHIESMTTVEYKTSVENLYVVSWIHNGTTFYKRVYVGGGAINTMEMASPESEGGTYNPYVDHMSFAFKPGDLLGGAGAENNNEKDTNIKVENEPVNLSEIQPEIQQIFDEALGHRGARVNSPVSEKNILGYFAQYMYDTDEKIDVIDHYKEDDISWNIISKESVDKYSEKYFGKTIIGDNHREQKELDGMRVEGYYEDQKYYFGFAGAGFMADTSIVIREIVETGDNMITCKVDSVGEYGDPDEVVGKLSIDLEKKDNRYIIKNIRE